jgi:3-deoxy-manno-octulosonate cytidylyltransferase (CMP-KDO synthetase)
MIEHVYRRATAARHVDAAIVATDDARIAKAVGAFGGSVRMTRPDHLTGTDRLAEIASALDCDLIVNVQGDEPLIEPDAIDAVIEPFRDDPALQMTTTCTRLSQNDRHAIDDPNVVKVVTDRRGYALYFSRSPIPFRRGPRDAATGPFKHLGLYVYRREFLLQIAALAPTPLELSESLEQLRVLENGFDIKVIETRHDAIGVDTPDDLDRVRRLLTADARA